MITSLVKVRLQLEKASKLTLEKKHISWELRRSLQYFGSKLCSLSQTICFKSSYFLCPLPLVLLFWLFFRHPSLYFPRKLRTLYAFPIFPVYTNISTPLMESWCIVFVENHFYSNKIILKKVSEPFIFRGIQEISVPRHIFFRNPLYILHLYKHATEYISKRASQQQGGNLVKCRRNSRLFKYLNESTERHPSVPNYTVRRSFHHGNLHYCLSPQLG